MCAPHEKTKLIYLLIFCICGLGKTSKSKQGYIKAISLKLLSHKVESKYHMLVLFDIFIKRNLNF